MIKRINYVGTARQIWESIKHTFGDSSTWDDGKFKKEDPRRRCMNVLSLITIW